MLTQLTNVLYFTHRDQSDHEVSGLTPEPALGMGEVGHCPGPHASEPLCETAVFAMFILSTVNFCPMLIL